MYQRTTTASRRRDRMMNTNWLHVSQWFKPTKIEDALGIEAVHMIPQMTRTQPDANGKPVQVVHGSTYNVGRNRFKRACRTLGLSRVKVERNLRAGQSAEYVMAQAGVL